MGYNAGGTYFENHRSSGFDTVANDVSCVVELTRSKRQTGMVQTNGPNVEVEKRLEDKTALCRRNVRNDMNIITNLDVTFADQVLPCPCTLNQARNDPRFNDNTQFRAESICYIQSFAASGFSEFFPIKYGQHCCYDSNG